MVGADGLRRSAVIGKVERRACCHAGEIDNVRVKLVVVAGGGVLRMTGRTNDSVVARTADQCRGVTADGEAVIAAAAADDLDTGSDIVVLAGGAVVGAAVQRDRQRGGPCRVIRP